MKIISIITILFSLSITTAFSQQTIDIEYDSIQGVIFCRNYFSEKHLATYKVFDLNKVQIEKFENELKKRGDFYPNFIRQYNGILKDKKHLIVAQLISKKLLEDDTAWRKKPLLIIDACEEVRSIVYNLDDDSFLWNRTGGGCN